MARWCRSRGGGAHERSPPDYLNGQPPDGLGRRAELGRASVHHARWSAALEYRVEGVEVTIERGLWMSFFTDMTNADIALRRAANAAPFIDISPAIARRLEAAADEVEAIKRAFLEGGKSG